MLVVGLLLGCQRAAAQEMASGRPLMGLVSLDFWGEGGEGVLNDSSRIPLLRRASEVRF